MTASIWRLVLYFKGLREKIECEDMFVSSIIKSATLIF